MIDHPASASRRNVVPFALSAASLLVLSIAVGASFRMGFGDGLSANAARASLAGAAGGLFALAGALRRVRQEPEGAAFELALFGASSGAAAGAALGATFFVAAPGSGAAALALLGGGVSLALVRAADRQRRVANLGAGLLLAVFIASAALAGSFGLQRDGFSADLIAWMLGDVSGATRASAALAIAVLACAVVLSLRCIARGGHARPDLATLGPVALGFGLGFAGVLGFIGSFVPRAVRAVAPDASPRAFLLTSVAAGAATVAAVDAVPRLLIGGYALPFAVSTGMLAVPIYLGWNRVRLRREIGLAHPLLEWIEVGAIVAGTLVAVGLAVFLTQIVRAAT